MRKTDSVSEKIFVEKNISDILETYRSGFKSQPHHPTRHWVISGFCFYLLGWIFLFFDGSIATVEALNESMVGFLLSFAGVGLGVLIAGFAIIAPALDSETFVALSEVEYKESGRSYLSFLFSLFIHVLMVFVGVLAVCLFYYAFVSPMSFLGGALRFLPEESGPLVLAISLTFSVMVASYSVFLLSSLKSFVFNLHQTLLFVGFVGLSVRSQREEGPSRWTKIIARSAGRCARSRRR